MDATVTSVMTLATEAPYDRAVGMIVGQQVPMLLSQYPWSGWHWLKMTSSPTVLIAVERMIRLRRIRMYRHSCVMRVNATQMHDFKQVNVRAYDAFQNKIACDTEVSC